MAKAPTSTSEARLVVLTGGPGSGKTTLIDALRERGFFCMGESGRAILRDHALRGETEPANADPERYARMMLERDWAQHRIGRKRGGTVFYDRGVPDICGYLRLVGKPMPLEIETALLKDVRYHPEVFIAPPWGDIYQPDEERKQNWHQAVATHDRIAEVYEQHGYRLVELPLVGVDERVEFMLERLGLA
jgi:predicted ATPase